MDNDTATRLRDIVESRMRAKAPEIKHSLRQIAAGNPLGAEPMQDRSAAHIAAISKLSARDAKTMSIMIADRAAAINAGAPEGAEARRGPTIDFVGIAFLDRGRIAANCVGRVILRSGKAMGTGFMVAPRLFLTNNHVIRTADLAREMVVEFDYELDGVGANRPVTTFAFDPSACFVWDQIERYDFALIAIGERVTGARSIDDFGYLPLSDALDKHMLGGVANIIQHPDGRPKQVVVRENNLVARDETNNVLHYLADTEDGSSGSPVCNNEWEPIALHHWAGPALEQLGIDGQPLSRDINEGIRISAIVRDLRAKVGTVDAASRAALTVALAVWAQSPRRQGAVAPESAIQQPPPQGPSTRTNTDGSITWTFPIEISVRAPLLDAAAKPAKTPEATSLQSSMPLSGAERSGWEDIDFSDRDGYEPGFIPGFAVPMPSLEGVPYRLARNLEAGAGDNPYELPYHHFSIVMNAERRLAAVTACNINGRSLRAVKRGTDQAKANPTLVDLGVAVGGSEGAEATDDFSPDRRVAETEQMTVEYYENQVVPGYAKPNRPPETASETDKKAYYRAMSERTARMFQKGHIILRGDPAWGQKDEALAAERDTFFYTNAAPQLGFFNQGSQINRPGSKGVLRWRALETYILRNAYTAKQRVCVFAGPVFDDDYDDIIYRFGAKLPMRFWKIAVWVEGDKLRSIALIADQKPLFKYTEGTPESAEAYEDPEELARVSELLTTVEAIEQYTALDFGDIVREADVRAGSESMPAVEASAEMLTAKKAPTPRRRPYKKS